MSIIEHFGDFFRGRPSILMEKNVALRWSNLEGKQKHNFQMRYKNLPVDSVIQRLTTEA